jgi:hypothetical protein
MENRVVEFVMTLLIACAGVGGLFAIIASVIGGNVYAADRWKVRQESVIVQALRSRIPAGYGDYCDGWWGVVVSSDKLRVFVWFLWWWQIPAWLFGLTPRGRFEKRRWALEKVTGVVQ